MKMEELAVINGIKKTRWQHSQDGESKNFFVRPILSKESQEKAESKYMLEMIDQELKQIRGIPELDFKAGYLAGRIKEKNMVGLITDARAEQLTKVLYSKYELMRSL